MTSPATRFSSVLNNSQPLVSEAMKLDYLDVITADNLKDVLLKHEKNVFSVPDAKLPVNKKDRPRFTTINPEYGQRLLGLAQDLSTYLTDDSLPRPFLYLILGPPGAGKSFLIKQLIKYLPLSDFNTGQPIIFQKANLSEMVEPRELHQLYIKIQENTANNRSTVTLLDEFDIKWSGGSAIKYLINPIYDGEFWSDAEFKKFGKCAFFFAGSYLQDLETLLKTQKILAGVNLNEFLFDLYFALRTQGDTAGMQEIHEMQSLSYLHEKWRADVDPRTDTIFYLSSLEKIKDFLSRVAGNIFEILDVSYPLHVTVDEFVLLGENAEPSSRVKLHEVISYVSHRLEVEGNKDEQKTIAEYGKDENPLLEYKNMILCERVLRVVDFLKGRFEDTFKETNGIYIDRKLLNFLTVAPLINGMRSLEQLIGKLRKPEGDTIQVHRFKPTDISMIVYEADKFGDPERVWAELMANNPAAPKPTGDKILVPAE